MHTHTQLYRILFIGLTMLMLGMIALVGVSLDPPRAAAQKPPATATPRTVKPAASPTPVKPQPMPAPQVKKPANVHIPHHRTGHLAKTTNLNDLVADGQTDPLAGNYNLVNWERIATLWNGTDNKVNTKVYAEGITETLGVPTPKVKGAGGATSLVRDVATGNLRSNQPPMIVGVSIPSDNHLGIHYGTTSADLNSFAGIGWTDSSAPLWVKNVAIAGGDFGGTVEELAVGYQNMDNTIQIARFNLATGVVPMGYSPVIATATSALDSGKFDVATGDFDGDGYAEAVVAWADNQHTNLQVTTMGNAPGVNPALTSAKANIFRGSLLPALSLSVGDVDGDAKDEIILLEEFGSTNAPAFTVSVYKVKQNMSGIESAFWYTSNDHVWQLTSAVGDFSLDGVDEIVISAKAASNAQVYLYVFAINYDELSKQWQLVQKTNLATGSYVSNFPRLAVGDVNRDVKAEIVSVFTTGNEHTNNVQIFEVNAPSDGAWSITSKGLYKDNSEQMVNNGNASVFVALGNLDQRQLRVGAPTHTLASNFLSTLAVINMPPKHKDTVGGKPYDIDPPNTYAKYENQQKTSTQMSATTKHTWDLALDFSYSFAAIFKMSIKATYGGEFEKTTTAFTSTTFAYGVEARVDDAVIYSIQDIDVWEYPVYSDASDIPASYMLVLFPRKVDPNCSTNCEGAKIETASASLVISPYAPNHLPYNVLSYSLNPPANISTTIKVGGWHDVGDIAWYESAAWSDVQSEIVKQTQRAGVGVESSIGEKEAPGHLDLKTSYNWSHISTNQTNFQHDTTISVWGGNMADNMYAYGIEPYFYWSKGGTLMLDYQVKTIANWWTTTYNHPDPAFNLPWADGKQGNVYEQMTREITFDPPAPKAGQSVTITAKIRNYSPVVAQNVKVKFFNGVPGAFNQIGSTHTIAQLNSMSYVIVQEHFNTSGYDNQTLNIYARIEPYTNEMHSDNNLAYAQLPVKSHLSRTSPATLSIASGEITFHSAPATIGVPTYVTATVRARGDTFTNVALEFWDGEPYRNGSTIIGGRLIPMVRRDQAIIDGIRWIPRGGIGPHTVWVNVRGLEAEDSYSDNRAYRLILTSSVIHYFPVIGKK